MNITVNHKVSAVPDGRYGPSGAIRRWAAFFAGLFFIWLFMFVLAPWLQGSPAVRPLARFIAERGIDASALYYTEVEEASLAETHMRNTILYMPKGRTERDQ